MESMKLIVRRQDWSEMSGGLTQYHYRKILHIFLDDAGRMKVCRMCACDTCSSRPISDFWNSGQIEEIAFSPENVRVMLECLQKELFWFFPDWAWCVERRADQLEAIAAFKKFLKIDH